MNKQPGLHAKLNISHKWNTRNHPEKVLERVLPQIDWIRVLGRRTLTWIRSLGLMGVFLGKAIICSVTPPLKLNHLFKQIYFIGFQSSVVILLTGGFTGMVMALQGYYNLNRFGSEAFLGPAVALTLIKELGPVISGLMVTGRAGSAITAEIGIMRMGDQIDAIQLMGLNPYRYIIVPNLLAATISLPLLTAIFDVIGIFGGYLVGGQILGVEAGTYFGEIPTYLDMSDVLEGLYKSIFFGIIIAWICCFQGYYADRSGFGTEGVSKATTKAVVFSSVMILVWDYFMTSLLF